jgi:2-methylisocitrate lyase-like PEP mutase family enzyme
MTQAERARSLHALHVRGDPLVLYNIWDAGSARAVAAAGARAVATGSWSVAAAQGYDDGEAIPLDFLVRIASRIAASVELPLTVDFEGGYATAPDDLAATTTAILHSGAVGVNFEDRIVQGEGLYPPQTQARRIAALRAAGDALGIPLFINARTDVFLGSDPSTHAAHLASAIARCDAYAQAGANGFFVPGLVAPELIARICDGCALPVNVMATASSPPAAVLARLGVARISHGPRPFRQAMAALTARCRTETEDPEPGRTAEPG